MSTNLTVIKAGAGAGKTTKLIETLKEHVLQFHKEKNQFPRVTVSTFTRKATRELKERIIIKGLELQNKELQNKELQNKEFIQYISYSPDFQVSTLHGIFNYFIQTHGYKIDLSPGVSVMDEKEEHELFVAILKQVIFEQNIGTDLLDHYSFEEITTISKHYVLHLQNHPESAFINKEELQASQPDDKENTLPKTTSSKNHTTDNNILLEQKPELALLDTFIHLCQELKTIGQKITPLWDQRKRELSQITLNDMETMTMQILKKEKNNLPNLMDFWFLDEYQDTSPLQKNILNLLSQNSKVFIVGDPQQSIYYFRGADVSVFQEKEQEVENRADGQIESLPINYRSCPELIAFFNDFFSEKYQKIEPKNKSYKKEKVAVHFIGINSPPEQMNPKQINKEEMEMRETTNRIKDLLKQNTKPEEIVVLARQNKALLKLAQYLKHQKIPIDFSEEQHLKPASLPVKTSLEESKSHSISLKKPALPVWLHAGGNFKNRREIIDAVFLLRFLFNPNDEENLIGLFRTPYCRISDQQLADIIQKKANTTSLWKFLNSTHYQERMKNTVSKKKDLKNSNPERSLIQKLKHHLEQTHKIGITRSFQNALESLGFFNLSYYQDPTGVREANLWKFIYCLKDYESKNPGNLLAFTDHLLYESQNKESHSTIYSQNAVSAIENSGVQLMTIHAAKGLEFKHVILIKVCSGFRSIEKLQYFITEKETGKWTLSAKWETEDKRIKSSFHKKIREQQKKMELQEFDRLLYVALTRAKETLTLIGAGKPEKNSWPERFSFFSRLENPGAFQTQHYTYTYKTGEDP